MKKDFPQPICEQIWSSKYKLTTPNPEIANDINVPDTWERIAHACAAASIAVCPTKAPHRVIEERRDQTATEFYNILEDFHFLPAGRITAGAGSGRNVTLFNCFVMGTIPDSIDGIFEMLKEAAITMQQGGGVGFDFTPLRPAGSPVRGVDADASGPLTFMDVWDAMCKTIMSAGYRRGAMMGTMRVSHPDIEEFIKAKRDGNRFRMFNLSVLCCDAFMRAVKDDQLWPLIHKRPPAGLPHDHVSVGGTFTHKVVRARDLWKLIMESTYDYAEPGVIFVDRINTMNNLWYMEQIEATNPCAEQPLPPYGACLLGSINLAKMVKNPFTNPFIDYDRIKYVAATAVRMLDSVIDIASFPLPQQKAEALEKRRMGIGITGMADMLFMLNTTYGSDQAAHTVGEVMRVITMACYEESIDLAQEYGPCPATATLDQRLQYLQSGFMTKMPPHIRNGVEKHGIRNALLTSIAPTGTISMYAGNVSSGIEPIFAAQYTRKILEDDGVTHREEVVQDYAVHLLHSLETDTIRPKEEMIRGLATAQVLTPADHLKMVAAVQPWVDSSISKTINCPEDISYDNFQEIYLEAYDSGLKGCTTYRPNAVTGSVLSVESDVEEFDIAALFDEVTAEAIPPVLRVHNTLTEPMDRPQNLKGTTYKLKWDTKSFYVTINDYVDTDGYTIPFEVFINSSEMASLQWTVALTRMISAVLRRGGQVDFIGEELKRISDPSGGFWINKKYVPSFVALLGQCIMDHMKSLKNREMTEAEFVEREYDPLRIDPSSYAPPPKPDQCPECYDYSLNYSGGCATCTGCGYSKCG